MVNNLPVCVTPQDLTVTSQAVINEFVAACVAQAPVAANTVGLAVFPEFGLVKTIFRIPACHVVIFTTQPVYQPTVGNGHTSSCVTLLILPVITLVPQFPVVHVGEV